MDASPKQGSKNDSQVVVPTEFCSGTCFLNLYQIKSLESCTRFALGSPAMLILAILTAVRETVRD